MISNLFNDALENFKKEYKPKATTSELPESRKLFWDQIPNELRKFVPNNNYEVYGSIGIGNATAFPWILLSNKKVTVSATKGFYLVYLFKKDMTGFFLSLGVGVTNFLETMKDPMTYVEVIIKDLQSKLGNNQLTSNKIDLGATRKQTKQWGYQVGSVASIFYEKDKLSDEIMIQDLKNMIVIYETLIGKVGSDFEKYSQNVLVANGLTDYQIKENSSSSTLKSFYLTEKNGYLTTDFDFTIDEWKEMLSNKNIFSNEDSNLINKWSKNTNSEISAKQFGQLEGVDLAYFRNKVVAIGVRISKIMNIVIYDDKRSQIYWPITMDGRYEFYENREIFIWKVKKNLIEALATIPIYSEKILKPENLTIQSKGFLGTNTIIYGVPGSGKSYLLDRTILSGEKNIYRTTFYPDYSISDFVGQILPRSEKKGNNESIIKYDFKSGPFSIALKEALLKPTEKVSLVIEELNRGNAPAIFGDLFQLLDRNDQGISEYPITNTTLQDYLNQFGLNLEQIYLPRNLFIYATMNTSDQNVFTLDNAFKRRWEMRHVPTEANSNHTYIDYFIPKSSVTWGKFLKVINNEILLSTQNELSTEDKQIGAYFIKKADLSETENNLDENIARRFANKLLNYIWIDIAKFEQRSRWFQNDIKSFDDLLDKFMAGEKYFSDDLTEKLEPDDK
jgi:hypothetical protein